jgi:transcriptional regulator with XRE-family HTH domain
MDRKEPFKKRLQKALDAKGWKPVDLAKRIDVSESTISQYRSGYAEPKTDRLQKIADALSVNPAWLLGIEVPMNIPDEACKIMNKGKKINVVGRVAAGIPIEAIENVIDTEEIPESIKTLIDKVEGDVLVPETEKTVLSRFSKAIERKGLQHITFHDLRHVNASLMVVLQIPDKYAQDRGGWKSDHIMKTTYQETFSAERKAVDQKIDNYFLENILGNNEFHISEKYRNWLSLFGKKDSEENRLNFEKFCKENNL